MGKPSVRYHWASLTNYGGGPASGTATRVAPSSGLQDEGWRPDDEPGAQVANALFGNFADWIAYLDANAVDGSLVIGGASVTIVPFTFTATSGSPGSITATAHGLQTGDGPVRVSNSGGGLPGGLAAGVDYWVIVVDANTLRLAVDRTNTLRATPIPIVLTSNGTGTQTLSPGTSPTRLGDLTVTRTLAVNGTAQTAHKLKVGGLPLVFPSFVFTASSATDRLTFADHGLKTGDGPVQVSNSGGALPTGLAAATDYWVITVDTSNVQLATSLTNAYAGVAIDLTSNGSGTNTLAATANTVAQADCEVTGGLTVDGAATLTGGVSNNVTLSGGATLPAGQELHHGTRTLPLTSAAFVSSGATHGYSRGSLTFNTTTTEAAFASIQLPAGCRILEIRVYVHDSSTGPSTVTATFYSVSNSGANTPIGSPQTSAGNNTDQTLTIPSLTTTIAAGTSYGIEVLATSASSTTVSVFRAEVDYDRP